MTKIAEIERSRRIREDARGGGERKRKRARIFTGLLGPALSLRRIAIESSDWRDGAETSSQRRLGESTPDDDADDENLMLTRSAATDALDDEERAVDLELDADFEMFELARQLDATRDFDAFGGDFGDGFEPYPSASAGSRGGGGNMNLLAAGTAGGIVVPSGGLASRGSATSRGSGSSHSASSGAPHRRSNPNSADEFDAHAGFGSDGGSGDAGRIFATASFFSALSPPSIGSFGSGGEMDIEGSGGEGGGGGGTGAVQPARLLSRWSR